MKYKYKMKLFEAVCGVLSNDTCWSCLPVTRSLNVPSYLRNTIHQDHLTPTAPTPEDLLHGDTSQEDVICY